MDSQLNNLSKIELINKCKSLNITGYSNKKKEDLINLIKNNDNTNDDIKSINYNKIIDEHIKNNSSIFDDINQILHNNGYDISKRYTIINVILQNYLMNNILSNNKTIDDNIVSNIKSLLNKTNLPKYELLQRFFMYYGNKYTQRTLDQYYTPISIGQFICSCIIENKNIIDPACGTGDLVITYEGNIDLYDISPEVLELTKINYEIHNKKVNIENIDSLLDNTYNNKYDYVILNPPFGTKTVINDTNILKQYILGKKCKKQEIGLLFIERSLNLLKENGILFAIIPSGYLGNINKNYVDFRKYLINNYKIISIIRLPNNTFSRSGTGVSTSLIIIQKKKIEEDYNILIDDIKYIGYELNKKNTPIKYKKNNDGDYILDEKEQPIMDNDLYNTQDKMRQYTYDNKIDELKQYNNNISYQFIKKNELINNDNIIIDIGRYLNGYKETLLSLKDNSYKLQDLCIKNPNLSYQKDKHKLYTYLDITEVNTPLYNGKKLYGYQLPQRAKYLLKRNDIIVSRLKGKISFTIIVDNNNNLIASNGFCVLRAINEDNISIIFGNLFNSKFIIQHNSLATGSIMESINDNDIMNIMIDKNIDKTKYTNIINSLTIIRNELNNS